MSLSERERRLVARRAYGEYAVHEHVVRIWRSQRKKNRNPDDLPYMEFMGLVTKRSYSWDDYDRLAEVVQLRHPYPWAHPDLPEIVPIIDDGPKKQAKKRVPREKKARKKRKSRKELAIEAEIAKPTVPIEEPKSNPLPDLFPMMSPPKQQTEDGLIVGDDGLMRLPDDWEPF